jgi:hypothetical protein
MITLSEYSIQDQLSNHRETYSCVKLRNKIRYIIGSHLLSVKAFKTPLMLSRNLFVPNFIMD